VVDRSKSGSGLLRVVREIGGMVEPSEFSCHISRSEITVSKDNQYTATGPCDVGFQTDGMNIEQGAAIGGNDVGVKGMCIFIGDGVQGYGGGSGAGVVGFGGEEGTVWGAPGVKGIGGGVSEGGPPQGNAAGVYGQGGRGNSDGVFGSGNGGYSGVAGFGGPESGTGVFGQGVGGGPGVRGIGSGGTNTGPPPGNAVGVYGQGGQGNSDGVQGIATGGGKGVSGYGSDGMGVYGQSQSGDAVHGWCSGSGAGASGGSFSGPGGIFLSLTGPVLNLVPSSTPLQDTAANPEFKLVSEGNPGDVYLYSANSGSGNVETSALWICLGTQSGASTPTWAQIPLGPNTIGG
jgi:hypothetical protein